MTEWVGRIIEYLDGDKLRPALVTAVAGAKLQAVDAKGRSLKIASKTVAVVHQRSDTDTLGGDVRDLMKAITVVAQEVDLILLWESVLGETDDLDLDLLAEAYFTEPSSVDNSALMRSLIQNPAYFRRRGLLFQARPRDVVETQRKAEKLRVEREAWRMSAITWLRSVPNAQKLKVPANLENLPQRLERFLFDREGGETEAILRDASGGQGERELAYLALSKSGHLPEDVDPWLASAGIRQVFPEEIAAEADALQEFTESADNGRVDLTHLEAVSIDDAETQDIDDAISWRKTEDGFEAGIHIADVACLIPRDSALDQEACRRISSVYLPTRIAPMFPERISNELASLHAGKVRPALSFLFSLGPDLELRSSQIVRSVLKVRSKLAYDDVDAELEAGSNPEMTRWRDFAELLRAQRLRDGAVIMLRPEMKIRVKDGAVSMTVLPCKSPSRDMIGELMIFANRTAANFAVRHDLPVIFRCQEVGPSVQRGIEMEYDPVNMAALCQGMRRTQLSISVQPHAGLGLDGYVQATSPIRRYTDLLVQRQIVAHLCDEPLPYGREDMMSLAQQIETTDSELRSLDGETRRYWQIEYISQHHRDSVLRGLVISQLRSGYLVELSDYPIRGILNTGERFLPGAVVAVCVHRAKAKRQELKFKMA
ncbi:MAG: exoribonuclease-2 [Rhodothermales bacterium]|jgi:exoribonuclease-2